jgi:hypothetical protein
MSASPPSKREAASWPTSSATERRIFSTAWVPMVDAR